jgi:hypothetical protein
MNKEFKCQQLLKECYGLASRIYRNGNESVDNIIKKYGSGDDVLRSIRRKLWSKLNILVEQKAKDIFYTGLGDCQKVIMTEKQVKMLIDKLQEALELNGCHGHKITLTLFVEEENQRKSLWHDYQDG